MATRSRTAAAVVEAPAPRVPALMHPDVQALLAVQADDFEVYNLEDRLTEMESEATEAGSIVAPEGSAPARTAPTPPRRSPRT